MILNLKWTGPLKEGYLMSADKESSHYICFRVALEAFSEAESVSIRSASKFCFDLDGGNFSNFSEKYFFGRSKDGDMIFFGKISNLKEFLKVSYV